MSIKYIWQLQYKMIKKSLNKRRRRARCTAGSTPPSPPSIISLVCSPPAPARGGHRRGVHIEGGGGGQGGLAGLRGQGQGVTGGHHGGHVGHTEVTPGQWHAEIEH